MRPVMTLDPTPEEQAQLAATRRVRGHRLSVRERIAAATVAGAFVAVEAGLWLTAPPRHIATAALAWTLVAMVLANRVQFETPFGFTVATQLAFVPLMFALPPALVPIAVCVSVVLAALPDIAAGRLSPARLVFVFRNCWFAFGPAWVFALADVHRHAGLIILLAALAAQFLVDFAASCVILFVTRGAPWRQQWREGWVYLIDAALSGVGYVVALQMRDSPAAVLAVVPLLGLLAMFARERTGRLEKLIELGDTYRGTALLLGDVVAADDRYTAMHSQGVVDLALAVADALGLPDDRRRNLEFAALLHDVGKISIPKDIINKPGRLDADEWALIKTHCEEGQRLLGRIGGFMTEVGEIVRSHHERWDGGGYPDGLLAEASPVEARIITCCDSWNAMRTDRPYRRALSLEQAVTEVQRNLGTQFDPLVAEALLTVVAGRGRADDPARVAAGRRSALVAGV
jgi:HD-GYP domain-containing protein (c-di-GMP phosphodiesterase class II)